MGHDRRKIKNPFDDGVAKKDFYIKKITIKKDQINQ